MSDRGLTGSSMDLDDDVTRAWMLPRAASRPPMVARPASRLLRRDERCGDEHAPSSAAPLSGLQRTTALQDISTHDQEGRSDQDASAVSGGRWPLRATRLPPVHTMCVTAGFRC